MWDKRKIFMIMIAAYIALGVTAYMYQNHIRIAIKKALMIFRLEQKLENLQEKYEESTIMNQKLAEEKGNDKQENQDYSDQKIEPTVMINEQIDSIIEPVAQDIQANIDFEKAAQEFKAQKNAMKSIIQNEDKTKHFKQASFERKLYDHLIKNYLVSLNKASNFIQKIMPKNIPAHFFIEIEKDGNVAKSMLIGSTGLQVADQFLNKVLENSAPFPPIPEHLGLNTYQFVN